MLTPWLELPGAADRLATWSEISGLYLAQLGITATAEEITDTAVTQPLVVAATLLAFEELTKRGLLAGATTIVAGHSVGEIAAYAIAGVISADEAIKLAATRGAEMAKACAVEPTGMSAVLGGDEVDIVADPAGLGGLALVVVELAPGLGELDGGVVLPFADERVALGVQGGREELTQDPNPLLQTGDVSGYGGNLAPVSASRNA